MAPFFSKNYKVAALDLSGMGDSGRRKEYNAGLRAEEIYGVIEDANLGKSTYVVGHSFGGLMTAKFAKECGDKIAGALIADSQFALRMPTPGENVRHTEERDIIPILLLL